MSARTLVESTFSLLTMPVTTRSTTPGAWTIPAALVITVVSCISSVVLVARGWSPILLIPAAWFAFLTFYLWRRSLRAMYAAALTFLIFGALVWCGPLHPFELGEPRFRRMEEWERMAYFFEWMTWSLFELTVGWRLTRHAMRLAGQPGQ